ncbi:MAG: hypothetical protein HYZ53_14865 [Planctomycetes bacterium]|nr:hypothetical protein [Planctomycetota bacterium]
MVLFCHITSQVPTDPYQNLLEEKGGNGFPFLAVLDAEGGVLAQHDGARSAAAFEATVTKAQATAKELDELRKKADGGDEAAKIDLLLRQCELGHVKPDQAKARLAELKNVPKEKQAKLDGFLANGEVMQVAQSMDGKDPQKMLEAGKKFAEMRKAGRVPTDEQMFQVFWILTLGYAESQKDAALFEEGLNALKTRFGPHIRKEWVEQNEAKLKAMKEAK